MNFGIAPFPRYGLLLVACLVSGASRADWVQSVDPLVVRPLPAEGALQVQNPPSFSWARHPSNPASYVLEIQGATTQSFTVARNWYLPSSMLAPGRYTWRVRPSTTQEWSSPRPFVIEAVASKSFLIPEGVALKARVTQRARPRQLTTELGPQKNWSAAMNAERGPVMTRLRYEVDRKIISIPVYKDSDWTLVASGTALTAALDAQNVAIRWAINDLGRQTEAASLLWRYTGEQRYLTEALTRGNQMAALSPSGPTSYASQDQGTRQIAMSLIKSIDLLAGDLDSGTKKRWLTSVTARTNDIYKSLTANSGVLDQYPFDSHGGTNLGYLALIATLGLGDIPEASEWFDFSFRSYSNSIYAWSGSEGGFANGTAYAQYTADYALQIWQPLTAATGINLFDKPWSVGFLRFLMHFVPPGAPLHAFGDQHEVVPEQRVMKAFASRFALPEAAWYVKNLTGEEDSISTLTAPWPMPVSTVAVPKPPANSALYPSIGWVAMHNDISDRSRTSVFFKSSPYGSFNHSHGDQNSLLISSGGRPLLIEAGYMDWYGSPLWNTWYRQSKSHNAITYDGGIGQRVDGYGETLARNGKITSFAAIPGLDFAQGNATAAYGGALTQAMRQIWYLRNLDVLVVQDKLEAPLPHVFEWNLHAPSNIIVEAGNAVRITNAERSLCIKPISTDIRFVKRTGPPPMSGTIEDHGAFVSVSGKTAEFVLVLDIGCKNTPVELQTTTTGRTLRVGNMSVGLSK